MKKIFSLSSSLLILILGLYEKVYASDRYWVGGTATWDNNTGTKWASTSGGAGGESVPTGSDNVYFDKNSGKVTISKGVGNVSNNLDFTGFTGTFNCTNGSSIYGNLVCGTGMTWTGASSMTWCHSTGIRTITSNGVTITEGFLTVGPGNGTNGTLQLLDDLKTTGGIYIKEGAFDANNKNIVIDNLLTLGTLTRIIKMGSGTWTLTGPGTVWECSATTNLTLIANNSTIKLTSNSTSQTVFNGGSLNYYNFWNATSNARVIYSGSNTFNNFKSDAGRTNTFGNGTVTEVNSVTMNGTSGNNIVINGNSHTLTCSTGIITVSYCTIQNSTATGGAKWCAQSSIDNGNNSGWSFSCCNAPQAPVNTTNSSHLIICNGNSTKLSANGTGKLSWYSTSTGGTYLAKDTNYTTPNLSKTTTFYVQDSTCEASLTRTAITVNVKPSLKSTSNLRDTTICFGQILNLNANGKGGDSSTYNFTWYLDNKSLLTNDSLTLKTGDLFSSNGESKILTLVLKDNCTASSDTIKKIITVLPIPKVDFSWGITCKLINTDFQYTGTTPVSIFNWGFSGESSSSIENPTKVFSTTGTKKVTLAVISPNGCSGSTTKYVDVMPHAKAAFSVNDICESDSATFVNKSQEAETYSWKFGDGQKANSISPKHLYNVNGITQTYNVTLVAIVSKGCSDSMTLPVTVNANPKSDYSFTSNGKNYTFTASQSGNSKYHWLFGDMDSAISQTSSHTYRDNLTFHSVCLKVTNAASCISETCKEIGTSGIHKIKFSNFKIYPNPNSGYFNIEMEGNKDIIIIEVIDEVGRLLHKVELSQSLYTMDINLANGVYMLKIINGVNCEFKKVVVNK